MLSAGRMGVWHAGQCDAGRTMLSPRGSREMQTFRKLPSSAAKIRPAGQATKYGKARLTGRTRWRGGSSEGRPPAGSFFYAGVASVSRGRSLAGDVSVPV